MCCLFHFPRHQIGNLEVFSVLCLLLKSNGAISIACTAVRLSVTIHGTENCSNGAVSGPIISNEFFRRCMMCNTRCSFASVSVSYFFDLVGVFVLW